ncbi:MAG: PEP-CTERM sorting domain-containing protein [Phycisphaerales bacterium]|nr:MAG: PEP-CTERM sorting domain-containing protein [Phycisphaerales bacterium]
MKKMSIIAAAAGIAALAGSASAFTFSPFNGPTISDNFWQAFQLDDSIVPAGVYTGFSVTVDWESDIQGASFASTWSNEARVAFADQAGSGNAIQPAYAGGETVYRIATNPSSGQASNSNNTTLTFGGAFGTNYTGGDLWFNFRQTFSGDNNINWNNVSISLILGQNYQAGAPAAVQPSAIDVGVQGGPGNYVMDTLGSNFDTMLGLYDQAGNLITFNDDFGGLQSLIDVDADTAFLGLDVGEYFLAITRFNTDFGATDFDVNPLSTAAAGDWELSINGDLVASGFLDVGEVAWVSFTVVPAPGAMALLALGGLVATRRRR